MNTVAIILVVLWLLGLLMGNFGLGAWLHVLLVVAIILFLVRLFKKQGGGMPSGGMAAGGGGQQPTA